MPWVHVADLPDLSRRDVVGVRHADQAIALYWLEDGVYATADACPHQSVLLSGGEVVDGFIECPGHYALFDIRTGRCEGGPTTKGVATYPVRLDGDAVYVLL